MSKPFRLLDVHDAERSPSHQESRALECGWDSNPGRALKRRKLFILRNARNAKNAKSLLLGYAAATRICESAVKETLELFFFILILQIIRGRF